MADYIKGRAFVSLETRRPRAIKMSGAGNTSGAGLALGETT